MSNIITYPTNPTIGQEFTLGNIIKVWDGEKWENKPLSNPHNVTKAQIGLGSVDDVSAANLRNRSTHTGTQPLSTISGTGTAASKNVGVKGGVAGLDSNGKVPLSQINDSILGQVEYKGLWDPTANSPTLVASPVEKGIYYICSAPGSRFGLTFEVGDWIISNGTSWDKVDNTDAVNSVNGRTGNVTISAADVDAYSKADSDGRYYTQSVSDGRYLNEANNLSDLSNATTARSNLGLGSAAIKSVGSNANQIPDKAILDTRLGTTGKLGTAATKNVGANNGVAPLDGSGKVPVSASQVATVNGKKGDVVLSAVDVVTTDDKSVQDRLDELTSITNTVSNFMQEDMPTGVDIPLGSRWFKPSTNQAFAYYFSDENPVGIWTETTNSY